MRSTGTTGATGMAGGGSATGSATVIGGGSTAAGGASDAAVSGGGASIAKLSSVGCSTGGRDATFSNANAPNSPAVATPAASADPIRRIAARPIRTQPRR